MFVHIIEIQKDLDIIWHFAEIGKINGMISLILLVENVIEMMLIREVLIYYYMKKFLSKYSKLILIAYESE